MKQFVYIFFFNLLFFIFSIPEIIAQNYIQEYPDPVLADSLPRIFASGIISEPESHEEGISFSPDGSEIYFTRYTVDEEGEKHSSLLYLEKQKDGWSGVKKPSFASNANESEAALSNDGNILYYFSERRKPGITPYIGEIWMVERSGSGWGKPQYRENILNKTWINSISVTSDGKLFFSSFRDKKMGIYSTYLKNGKYVEPEFLPGEVNSIAGATNPFISADGNTLLFEGQTTGYGNTEIFISFKTSRGIWTPAQRLNDSVNKTHTETNPSLSRDGKYLFFTRNGDIYWVRIEYIF